MKVGIYAMVSASLLAVSVAPGVASSGESASGGLSVRGVQYGVSTVLLYDCQQSSLWESLAANEIAGAKSLRANSIALAWPFYTSGNTSNDFFGRSTCGGRFHTPPPEQVAQVVTLAHKAGLSVFLRPYLDEANLIRPGTNNWRGTIKPSNARLWFRNYLSAMRPYLQIAQANHVEHFAISSELSSMANQSYWTSLISTAKKLYAGDLVFTASWAQDGGQVTHVGTSYGIDAYQWVSPSTPKMTPSQLLANWNRALRSTNKVKNTISKTTIDEVGILAQDGAYNWPYKWKASLKRYPFNQSIQANWFTMVCSFFKSHRMRGVYFWGPVNEVNGGRYLSHPDPNRPQDLQPAAQAAIHKCFSS